MDKSRGFLLTKIGKNIFDIVLDYLEGLRDKTKEALKIMESRLIYLRKTKTN